MYTPVETSCYKCGLEFEVMVDSEDINSFKHDQLCECCYDEEYHRMYVWNEEYVEELELRELDNQL